MTVYRMDLAYDGSGFRGYATQMGVRTVQDEIEAALSHIVPGVKTVVAGRTDAGVHADGQVVSFESDEHLDTERLLRSLNKMLNPEIAVTALAGAPDGFDARFSALSRTYRYRIDNGEVMDPQWRHRAWHVGHILDLERMASASQWFVGRHDFTSFCRAAEGRTTIRDVFSADWRYPDGGLLEFEVTASSFCRQMVRALVAVCVDIGRGRIEVEAVPSILLARDRAVASGAAPPHGLTLWRVSYEPLATSHFPSPGPL